MTLPFALAIMQPSASGSSPWMPILFQVGAFMAIMYFIMVRPQQQQKKKHEEALLAMKKGDEIVTSGGIVAHVIHLQQKMIDGASKATLEDLITIRSGEAKLIVERGKIARVMPKTAEAAPNA